MIAADFIRHGARPWVLPWALFVWLYVPVKSLADKPPAPPPERGSDAAVFRDYAFGDRIVAIAAIDSMSPIVWRDGVGAGMPHLRLHLDIKKVLYGPLSPETIVVSDNVAVCYHGEPVVVVVTVGPFWPYVGDLVLFGADRVPHDGKNVWHVTEMRLVGAYGRHGASLYETKMAPPQRAPINCSGGKDRGMNNCIRRTLTESGVMDEVLRAFAVWW